MTFYFMKCSGLKWDYALVCSKVKASQDEKYKKYVQMHEKKKILYNKSTTIIVFVMYLKGYKLLIFYSAITIYLQM